jgi:V/A-type H+-transporting ATPase subunit I
MAIVELKKVRIVAHHTVRARLLDELQQSGWVHITDLKETPHAQQLGLEGLNVSYGEITDRLGELEYAMNFLAPYEPPQGWREKLTQGKPVITRAQLEKTIKENKLEEVCRTCRRLDEKISELSVKVNELKTEIDGLSHWCELSIPIQELAPTRHCQVQLVRVPQEDGKGLRERLEQEMGELLELQPVSEGHDYSCELLIYLKQDEQRVTSLLADYGVEPAELPDISGTPAEAIARLEQEQQELIQKQKELVQQAKQLATRKQKLALAYDYYNNQKIKAEVQGSFLATAQVFLVDGWISRRHAEKLKQRLEDKYPEMELIISDPEPGEIPPVELANNRLVTPFEAVTKLYGLPRHDELDPTPLLAPFFFVFFGLCLTDGGYGLVLALLTYWGLRHLLLAEGSRNLVRLLFLSGVAAILAGAITGSWFGDIIDFLPEAFHPLKTIKNSLIVFDPINDPNGPMLFMGISLVLGFLQVWFGIGVKLYAELREKNIGAALLDQLPWLLIFLGLSLFGLHWFEVIGQSWATISLGLIYSGAGIILLFSGREHKNIFKRLGSGILGLYNSIGYFSDILSYSRLLALGLATGVIATVVNKIAFMTTGIPVIGYIFMFLILIGGHIFNLAISGLGAFVHTSRLQFVEFFPKFFQGGGKLFTPFAWESKYSVVKE